MQKGPLLDILTEIGQDKILLDCGGGFVSRLIETGHMPSDITHLFFTHLHSDHMMDYARLIHAAWDEGKISMPVYGPAPLARITNQLFSEDGVFSTDPKRRCEFSGSRKYGLRELALFKTLAKTNYSRNFTRAPH